MGKSILKTTTSKQEATLRSTLFCCKSGLYTVSNNRFMTASATSTETFLGLLYIFLILTYFFLLLPVRTNREEKC